MSEMLRRVVMMMRKSAAQTYATWNPADKNAAITLSGGNLVATTTGTTNQGLRGTIGKSSGKWYWELTAVFAGNYVGMAIANSVATLSNWFGSDANGSQYGSSGDFYNRGGVVGAGTAFTTGDVIGLALDMDARTLSFYKNNVLQGTLNSTQLPAGTLYAAMSTETRVAAVTANFGATPLTYTPPAGYNAGLYA